MLFPMPANHDRVKQGESRGAVAADFPDVLCLHVHNIKILRLHIHGDAVR